MNTNNGLQPVYDKEERPKGQEYNDEYQSSTLSNANRETRGGRGRSNGKVTPGRGGMTILDINTGSQLVYNKEDTSKG